jgi:CarD family transcriptional regulator
MTHPSNDQKAAFEPGDVVVYPSHGVGTVTDIETQRVADQEIKLFVINFEVDKMVLRVPLKKAQASGMRGLSTKTVMESALATFKKPVGPKRGMWNRRALEYTAKIKSGDPISLAEVVRDLYRPVGQPQGSYSERLLYEQALGRLSHEIAAVERTEIADATTKLEQLLEAA